MTTEELNTLRELLREVDEAEAHVTRAEQKAVEAFMQANPNAQLTATIRSARADYVCAIAGLRASYSVKR